MLRLLRRFRSAVSSPAALLAAAMLWAGGCTGNADYLTEDRLSTGLVIILPGIEGASGLNRDVRRGLVAGGVHRALPIHVWGRPLPFVGVLVNQVDFVGNRIAGIGIADMIANYQDSHPGRPVHIVGHSGGGGVAVFAAEALDKDRQIDGLILLSASISSGYDLTKALSHCRKGIVNFYNTDDAGLLGVGTTVVGTVDGRHGPSAGLYGFDKLKDTDSEEKKTAYQKLFQVRLNEEMAGDSGAHVSTTRVGFVSRYVSPWVLADSWPGDSHYAPGAPRTDPNSPRPTSAPFAMDDGD